MPPPDTQEEFSYTNRKTSVREKIDTDIAKKIKKATRQLKQLLKATRSEDEKKEIQAQLDKINSLKLVIIPTQEGNKRYYSIADTAGGVTQKTCLIDEDTLKNNLEKLAQAQNIDDVMQNKIRMNAILKHPKATLLDRLMNTGEGDDTEVQREAIGLKIARLLGFSNVTDCTMVYHDTGNGRHPCLFVPFGDMKLMTEFIEDKRSMHGRLKKKYFDSVEDFGQYSAYFMLSGDPDFIGKKGGNKGLTGTDPKKMYFFDQVFMATNNFGLDRAFNLIPTNFLSNLPNFISRHFMGRNKSVVNDSSFEEKIQGAIGILQKKEDIKNMFKEIAKANSEMPDDPTVKKLQKDTKECRKSFNDRIRSIEKLFPPIKINGSSKQVGDLVKAKDDDNLKLLKKSMLVTQLINKPKLYDKSGKPYRAPFFTNPSTYVKHVSISGDQVTISFDRRFGSPLSESKKAILRQQGFKISPDGKSAITSKENLLKLNEHSYFKEQENEIDPKHNYIQPEKMKALANIYNESDRGVQILISSLRDLDKPTALKNVLKNWGQLPFKNKGFAAHVQQCFLYEAMKVLLNQNPEKEEELKSGFQLAKREGKLDSYVQEKLLSIVPSKKKASDFRTVYKQDREQSLSKPTETNIDNKPPQDLNMSF
ncbi:coiled-coil protein [Legionella gratiana]|uniref:Coiled-coil protein n=1 Tax=Legionella gratiana TaxID=45066 RepID=A0A378J7E1_9GAMM|nr:hypothetical protein [Legionella gratiana]KTD10695.1 coiled-coil protein [Legionella gratiana]STX43724.1 coiled-coil protein [Legionella gratiana]